MHQILLGMYYFNSTFKFHLGLSLNKEMYLIVYLHRFITTVCISVNRGVTVFNNNFLIGSGNYCVTRCLTLSLKFQEIRKIFLKLSYLLLMPIALRKGPRLQGSHIPFWRRDKISCYNWKAVCVFVCASAKASRMGRVTNNPNTDLESELFRDGYGLLKCLKTQIYFFQ